MDAQRVFLLALVIILAAYDWRWRRLPNWVTLPLLAAGLFLGFPGVIETWLGCLLLFTGWRMGAWGGGDAKLWMVLLWLAPLASPRVTGGLAFLAMAISLTACALGQILLRAWRGRVLVGVRGPGAWRAVPFALWLLVVG